AVAPSACSSGPPGTPARGLGRPFESNRRQTGGDALLMTPGPGFQQSSCPVVCGAEIHWLRIQPGFAQTCVAALDRVLVPSVDAAQPDVVDLCGTQVDIRAGGQPRERVQRVTDILPTHQPRRTRQALKVSGPDTQPGAEFGEPGWRLGRFQP